MGLSEFTAKLSATPLPWQAARALSWVLTVNAVVTGWDYTHTPSTAPVAMSLKIVVRIASLHAWGVAFIVAGAVLAVGLTLRRHAVVWIGHLTCSVLYFVLFIATTQAVMHFSQTPAAQTQGSIWRAVTQSLAIFSAHLLLCLARGPVPRRGDER